MPPKIARIRALALAGDALSDISKLIETEVALARAEMSEKMQAVAGSLGFLVGGAIFLMAALFLLLQAIVRALESAGMAPHWATLLVAAVAAILGAGLFYVGRERFDPIPHRTMKELSRDSDLVEEQLS